MNVYNNNKGKIINMQVMILFLHLVSGTMLQPYDVNLM